jgi:hypothetical protein
MTEHQIQSDLIKWLAKHPDPRTGMIFAIPNGGWRSQRTASTLKAEGVRAGVPDLFLPIPCNGYHGLFIELKTPTGRPTPEQKQWIDALNEQGYKAVICKGLIAAQTEINNYLSQACL